MNPLRTRVFPFILTWLLLLATAQRTFAQVIINEVYPNPNTAEDEWVELYNSSGENIDLIDWKLWDQESSPGIAHQFIETTELEPQAFLVISMHNVLNNTGDTLLLKNPQDELIDTLGYSASTKGKSWARDPNNLTNIFETTPTQGEANLVPILAPTPTPIPSPSPSTLLPALSEIMACPDDSAEWVELYNPHDSQLPLLGFSLRDSKAKILGFTDEQLEPHSWVAFELRNVLNNNGDTVSLISPSNQVVESFAYAQCKASLSWVKNDGHWEQTTIITQHAPNIYSQLQPNEATASTVINEPNETSQPNILGVTTKTSFVYPLSVLKPKLSHEKFNFPSSENIVFSEPPRLERGALGVIMGGFLLLIPGLIYAKQQQIF